MKKIKVLAFDLMGVLYGEGHINREYLMPFLKFSDKKYPLVHQAYLDYKLGKITKEEFWRLIGKQSTLEGKYLARIKRSINRDFLKLIKKLDLKYQFVAITDLPEPWAINLIDINSYNFTFDYSVISAWTGKGKNGSLANFKIMLKKMKAKGSEVLFCDDLLANLKSAGQLGIKTVWFPRDLNRPEQKVKYQPDYQIERLSDLLKIVK